MNNGQQAGMVVREDGAGGMERARGADVGSSALAAAAEAEVKARFVMARHNPRNDDLARRKILDACKRPAFAVEKVAMYARPVGGGKTAEGLSIHFAREMRRHWGNVDTLIQVVYEDSEKRIWRVASTDLEANIRRAVDVVVEKVVERRQLRDGDVPIRSRINSRGEPVYLIEANEDALLPKEKALIAKAERETITALIPADILDECKATIKATQRDRDAKDPAAARKAIFDAFAEIGVMPDQIEERYLGHPMEQCTPDEMFELRGLYAALRAGEITSWTVACAMKHGETGDASIDDAATKAKQVLEERKRAIADRAAKPQAAPVPAERKRAQKETPAATAPPPAPASTEPHERQPGEDG